MPGLPSLWGQREACNDATGNQDKQRESENGSSPARPPGRGSGPHRVVCGVCARRRGGEDVRWTGRGREGCSECGHEFGAGREPLPGVLCKGMGKHLVDLTRNLWRDRRGRGWRTFTWAAASAVSVSRSYGLARSGARRRRLRARSCRSPASPQALCLLGRDVPGCPEHRSRERSGTRGRRRLRSRSRRRGCGVAGQQEVPGLTSRWTTPCACAWSSAGRRLFEPRQSTRAAAARPPARAPLRANLPLRYSMTMNGRPSIPPTSKVVTVCGSD